MTDQRLYEIEYVLAMAAFSRILRALFFRSTPTSHPQTLPSPPIRIPIGTPTDFPEGRGVGVVAAGKRLAIFRIGERIFAINNVCTHNYFPLADGQVQGAVVTCRTHGARFNLETGTVVRGPARKPVRVYPVHIVGETVEVEVD